jgi:hypothetical protein
MAPPAYWKGYLKLSLDSCPIALFSATSEREKISFHQLNKKTGHRVKYRKVDAESGNEVDSADIIKGYVVGKGDYIELDPEELEAVAIESKRTIDIDEFVPKDEIDELYLGKLIGQLGARLTRQRNGRSARRHAGRAELPARKSSLITRSTGRALGTDCTVSGAGTTGKSLPDIGRARARPVVSLKTDSRSRWA